MTYPGSYEYNDAEGYGHCHHGYPTGSCDACRAEQSAPTAPRRRSLCVVGNCMNEAPGGSVYCSEHKHFVVDAPAADGWRFGSLIDGESIGDDEYRPEDFRAMSYTQQRCSVCGCLLPIDRTICDRCDAFGARESEGAHEMSASGSHPVTCVCHGHGYWFTSDGRKIICRYHRCAACAGVGRIEELGVSGPIGSKTCTVCGGSGQKAAPMTRV